MGCMMNEEQCDIGERKGQTSERVEGIDLVQGGHEVVFRATPHGPSTYSAMPANCMPSCMSYV